MAKRPRPIRDMDDAMTWLAYFARFAEGDLRRHATGILDVMVRMDLEAAELRERCTGLAKRLETLEAKGEGL